MSFKLAIYKRNTIRVTYSVCLIKGKALKWAKVSAIDVIDLDLSPGSKNMYEESSEITGERSRRNRDIERDRTVCDSPVFPLRLVFARDV